MDDRNLIHFARERDKRAWEFLELCPATYEQLVKAEIYPTTEKARERIKRAEKQGFVAYIAHVRNRQGHMLMLFARFEVDKPQHEYEITELIIAAKPKAARRGYQVGNYRPDAELLFGETVVYLERERTRKSLDKVRDRIRQYDGCTNDVCWVVDTDTRISNIMVACDPPPNHYFTTYDKAVDRWHDRTIWKNNQVTP